MQANRQRAEQIGRRLTFAGERLHFLAQGVAAAHDGGQALQYLGEIAAGLRLDADTDREEVGIGRAGAPGKTRQRFLELAAIRGLVHHEPELRPDRIAHFVRCKLNGRDHRVARAYGPVHDVESEGQLFLDLLEPRLAPPADPKVNPQQGYRGGGNQRGGSVEQKVLSGEPRITSEIAHNTTAIATVVSASRQSDIFRSACRVMVSIRSCRRGQTPSPFRGPSDLRASAV